MGSCVHGFIGGLVGSWVHEFIGSLVGSWFHTFIGSSVHRFIGSLIHGFMGSWVHRFLGSWDHGFMLRRSNNIKRALVLFAFRCFFSFSLLFCCYWLLFVAFPLVLLCFHDEVQKALENKVF